MDLIFPHSNKKQKLLNGDNINARTPCGTFWRHRPWLTLIQATACWQIGINALILINAAVLSILLLENSFNMWTTMSRPQYIKQSSHQTRLGITTQIRANFRFAHSQCEKVLLCNDVSHWLGANLESALQIKTPHWYFLFGNWFSLSFSRGLLNKHIEDWLNRMADIWCHLLVSKDARKHKTTLKLTT